MSTRLALPVSFTRSRSTWAWLLVVLVLLEAAMPVLASAAAQQQGKTVVEVCTVYGVRTLTIDTGDHVPTHPGADVPVGGECGLTALSTGALPAPMAWVDQRTLRQTAIVAFSGRLPGQDAVATWWSGRKQGPPASDVAA